jgi:holin-like protein
MILGFLALLACQLIGQFLVDAVDLPVPGPVVGMVLLLVVLLVRRPALDSGTVRAADALLRHLQLLFIPAGVGLIAYLRLIGAQWWPIVAGIVVSWLVALLVTAGIGTAVVRWQHRRSAGNDAAAAAAAAGGPA